MNDERYEDDQNRYAVVEYDGSDSRYSDADIGDDFAWGSILGLENLGWEFDVDSLR